RGRIASDGVGQLVDVQCDCPGDDNVIVKIAAGHFDVVVVFLGVQASMAGGIPGCLSSKRRYLLIAEYSHSPDNEGKDQKEYDREYDGAFHGRSGPASSAKPARLALPIGSR